MLHSGRLLFYVVHEECSSVRLVKYGEYLSSGVSSELVLLAAGQQVGSVVFENALLIPLVARVVHGACSALLLSLQDRYLRVSKQGG